jgi:hypothetical protein
MQAEHLAEVFNSSGNSNEAADDTYFLTVLELISTMWEDKPTFERNLGDSQGKCTESSLLQVGNLTIYR